MLCQPKSFIFSLFLFFFSFSSHVEAVQEHIKIAFGSCSHQDKPLNILKTVVTEDPDVMLFLGDNIYGDTEDMEELKAKYEKLGANENFQELKRVTNFHAIWDDHDYGENDAGRTYPMKHESKQIFLDFWEVTQSDKRWQRKDGIYHSTWLNTPSGRKVHIIFPDLRFNREDISSVSKLEYFAKRKPKNLGPYKKDESASKTMLGKTQWAWLEKELAKPADVKIIASSLQVLADFTGWEAWHNFPYDISKLFNIIDQHRLQNIFFVSGDTHWTEISKDQTPNGITMYELTSSGLSEEWKDISPNKNRISPTSHENNYGLIEILFNENKANIVMGAKNIKGELLNSISFDLQYIDSTKNQKELNNYGRSREAITEGSM